MNKHIHYLKYTLTHKYYVLKECIRYDLWRQGIVHDWSKFLPSEWFPYVNYFNGCGSDTEFNTAWNHHQKRNPHHWQYWLLFVDGRLTPLEMPRRYRLEMVCDWIGVALANGKNRSEARIRYHKNKHKIILHPTTRTLIENELEQRT